MVGKDLEEAVACLTALSLHSPGETEERNVCPPAIRTRYLPNTSLEYCYRYTHLLVLHFVSEDMYGHPY
jgi:hypothetical protein